LIANSKDSGLTPSSSKTTTPTTIANILATFIHNRFVTLPPYG